jgi:hypothetical protein
MYSEAEIPATAACLSSRASSSASIAECAAAENAILSHYASANARTAKELDLPYLFPDPESEPEWEPFPGLTPETAFAVASRLDRDFALARRAEMDAAPVQYMTREQRICRAASGPSITWAI